MAMDAKIVAKEIIAKMTKGKAISKEDRIVMEKSWNDIITILFEHMRENAEIIGTAPSHTHAFETPSTVLASTPIETSAKIL